MILQVQNIGNMINQEQQLLFGCVRLSVKDAKWIFDNCAKGTKVEFYSDSNPGPLGKPSAKKISSYPDYLRNWDPTDPNSSNPWLSYKFSNAGNTTTNTSETTTKNDASTSDNTNNTINNNTTNTTNNTNNTNSNNTGNTTTNTNTTTNSTNNTVFNTTNNTTNSLNNTLNNNTSNTLTNTTKNETSNANSNNKVTNISVKNETQPFTFM